MIKNVTGSPATGNSFYDREDVQRRLWLRLDTDSVLLLAPRRVGKTSLLHRLKDSAAEHDFRAVYLSVSHRSTELAFIEALYKAIGDHSEGRRVLDRLRKGPLKALLVRVTTIQLAGATIQLGAEAEPHWQQLGEALADGFAELDGPWLMMVDELPLFVLNLLKQDDGVDRARTFLNWFRELRIARSVATHVRWLLCGSIGLDTVTARLGFGDAINDLFIVHLGAFDEPTADGFLSALADSYDVELDEAARAHALQRVGWLIPYHLQVLFAALRENDRRPVDEAMIDAAYEALLTPVHKGYFDFWQQRLHEELGQPDDGHALALLNAVARDPDGASDEVLRGVLAARIGGDPAQTLRYLRDVLENDGYLVRDGDRWRFRSNLLRDYWCRRVLP